MTTLKRPQGLGEDEWSAIRDAEDRLLRAKAAPDAALVIGIAKELCEAIAKVVAAERGQVPLAAADMPELVTTAHRLLEFQPGQGLADDPESRKIAQGLKQIVLGLGEMRNRHGTGHGRPVPSGVTEDHAQLAFDAAFAWSGWALRRLEPYIAGDVTTLVRDLEADFRSGELASRLTYANLARLPPEEQKRLGIAVARRASRSTFVVRQDGIEAARSEDEETWPRPYVEGLVEGLFFDPNGYVDLTSEWKVSECARLIAGLRDRRTVLNQLAERVNSASSTYGVATDEDTLAAVGEGFENTARLFAQDERELWLTIGHHLRTSERDGPGSVPSV